MYTLFSYLILLSCIRGAAVVLFQWDSSWFGPRRQERNFFMLSWADEHFVGLLRKIFWLMRENVCNTALNMFSWRYCHLKYLAEFWQYQCLLSFPRKVKIFLHFSGTKTGLSRNYCDFQKTLFRFMGLTTLQFDLKYSYNELCEGFKWCIKAILLFAVKWPTVISIPLEFIRVIASSWNLENSADSLHFKSNFKAWWGNIAYHNSFEQNVTAAFLIFRKCNTNEKPAIIDFLLP